MVRANRWLVLLILLLAAGALVLGYGDGAWWRGVWLGRGLELEPLEVSQLPLPLVEAYGDRRWTEGVDAIWDPAAGTVHVLIRWGQRPTGGYQVLAKGARLVRRPLGWQVRVEAEYVSPSPGQPVIEVVTFPAAGARIVLGEGAPAQFTVVVYDQRGKVHGSAKPEPLTQNP